MLISGVVRRALSKIKPEYHADPTTRLNSKTLEEGLLVLSGFATLAAVAPLSKGRTGNEPSSKVSGSVG